MRKNPRLYHGIWEKIKQSSPSFFVIDSHPCLHPRWLKAIRKEAYADISYKRELAATGKKFVMQVSRKNPEGLPELSIRIVIVSIHAII